MNLEKEFAFEDAIWERVVSVIKEQNIKQAQLLRKCEEAGMPISQPELSKLHNRKKKINLYELVAIAKALDVSVDFFVFGKLEYKKDFLGTSKKEKLTGDLESDQLTAYLGDYYIYYNKTDDSIGAKQNGTMSITDENDGYCRVKVNIHTGEYINKREIVKKYEGRILITLALSGAYFILRNDKLGELCFMILRHRTFSVRQLECRLALCLTISAGESKLPTVHKMIITRMPLSEEQLEIIGASLDLYNKNIRIEKSKAYDLLRFLKNEEERQSMERLWGMLPEKQYFEVSVELLRQYLALDRYDFAVFISKLLSLADTIPYAKVYESDDNLLYALLENEILIDHEKSKESPPFRQ